MTQRGKIEKLDDIIKRRLGKKANALWQELKRDLFVAEILRNHINKSVVYKPEIKKMEDGSISSFVNFYYDYACREMEEKDKKCIEIWLLNNIDKERLKEWLK